MNLNGFFKKMAAGSLFFGLLPVAHADEGMWVPLFLSQNQERMQALGMQLTAEDIYSVNQSSLKDAVVIFGGGCTGELVSGQGLVLTNHHCGYDAIQSHSSVEHDYLTLGFWAGDFAQELPCPGLEVRFLKEMRDVSQQVLQGLQGPDGKPLPEAVRQDSIRARSLRLTAGLGQGEEGRVVPFYYGNQYFLFIYEVFPDVRLVGAPPSNIGKFGGDTDNWVFPRHTGDFSVFRIYADSLNRPAAYSPENRPYKPKRYLKIDLGGYEEGDFTFVFGYPGRTQEYLSSYGVEQILEQEDPMRISARTERLAVIKAAMDKDSKTRIQYSAKAAGIANGWKKWMGEVKGIQRLDVVGSKREYEKVFGQWASSPQGKAYAGVLPALEKAYQGYGAYQGMAILFQEHTLAPEAVSFAYSFRKLCQASKTQDSALGRILEDCRARAEAFYKDYDPGVDKEIFLRMAFMTEKDGTRTPVIEFPGSTLQKQADRFYGKSIFTQPERMLSFLEHYKPGQYKTIERDPLYKYAVLVYGQYLNQTAPAVARFKKEIDSLQRIYMKGQMELKALSEAASRDSLSRPDQGLSNTGTGILYPDANFTLRVAYGQVAGFSPSDALYCKPYTTLDGIMEKENPDIYDYVVEERLKDLHARRDYGRYANALGEMPVAFIGTNHTTGGNSGSPVLNAEGNLIGINFDRNWEGTMSDIRYDAEMCRNIMLDIRYCLFIIDKFAGATRLVEEMEIVGD